MGQNQNDSSIANESLSQGYGGTSGTYGSFVGLANPETTTFWNTPTSNSVYKSSANPPVDTYDPLNNTLEDVGTNSYPGYRIPRYMNNNTNNLVDSTSYVQDYTDPSNPSDSGTNYRTSSNIYSYGNYYNWPAAMANTNYILDRDVSDAAGTSICPYNWHLPSSGDLDRECGVLSQSYGGNGGQQVGDNGVTLSNRIRSFPNSFVYSGRIEGSSFTDRGTGGYYTSRSVSSYESARVLQFWPTFFAPTYSGVNRSWGTTVRCLIAP